MQYVKFTIEQRISMLNDRIEDLEHQHAERDIAITDVRGRLNIAIQKKHRSKIEEHSKNLEDNEYDQVETEQVIRLLIAEREELSKEAMNYGIDSSSLMKFQMPDKENEK